LPSGADAGLAISVSKGSLWAQDAGVIWQLDHVLFEAPPQRSWWREAKRDVCGTLVTTTDPEIAYLDAGQPLNGQSGCTSSADESSQVTKDGGQDLVGSTHERLPHYRRRFG
jgi:hypothetical protein